MGKNVPRKLGNSAKQCIYPEFWHNYPQSYHKLSQPRYVNNTPINISGIISYKTTSSIKPFRVFFCHNHSRIQPDLFTKTRKPRKDPLEIAPFSRVDMQIRTFYGIAPSKLSDEDSRGVP